MVFLKHLANDMRPQRLIELALFERRRNASALPFGRNFFTLERCVLGACLEKLTEKVHFWEFSTTTVGPARAFWLALKFPGGGTFGRGGVAIQQ